MKIEEQIRLITRNTEEVVMKEEIEPLFKRKKKPNAYIGFELSGRLHIGNGLLCSMKMHDLVNAGVNMTIFLADWHSWVNNKLDGDLDKIKVAGEYFKQGSLKNFLKQLPKHEVIEAMNLAISRFSGDNERIVKYFCGICWKKIKGVSFES